MTALPLLSQRSSAVIEIRVFSNLAELRAQWSSLLDSSEGTSIFQCWEWANAWVNVYGASDLLILAGFCRSRLVGLLPLYISRWPKAGSSLRVLRLIADLPDDTGGLGVIAQNGKENDFCRASVAWLSEHHKAWDAMELLQLPPSPANTALLALIHSLGWTRRTRPSVHSVIAMGALPLKTNSSSELVRARKKLGSREVRFEMVQRGEDTDAALKEFFALHQRRWAEKKIHGAFSSDLRKDFYRTITPVMLQTGFLELWRMLVDGRTVAMEFGLVRNETRYSLQSGFDPDYARFSVGKLLDAHILDRAKELRLSRYDLLQGDREYKARLGASPVRYVNLRCAPKCSLGSAWVRASRMSILQKIWAVSHKTVAQH